MDSMLELVAHQVWQAQVTDCMGSGVNSLLSYYSCVTDWKLGLCKKSRWSTTAAAAAAGRQQQAGDMCSGREQLLPHT